MPVYLKQPLASAKLKPAPRRKSELVLGVPRIAEKPEQFTRASMNTFDGVLRLCADSGKRVSFKETPNLAFWVHVGCKLQPETKLLEHGYALTEESSGCRVFFAATEAEAVEGGRQAMQRHIDERGVADFYHVIRVAAEKKPRPHKFECPTLRVGEGEPNEPEPAAPPSAKPKLKIVLKKPLVKLQAPLKVLSIKRATRSF